MTIIYLVDFLVRLFHEKLRAYDLALGDFSAASSTKYFQPFFSTNVMASSLLAKSTRVLDSGSPVEAQPIKLDSILDGTTSKDLFNGAEIEISSMPNTQVKKIVSTKSN